MREDARKFYHVYADESRQHDPRHMLFGCLFIPRGEVEQRFVSDIAAFRARRALPWEIKWQKVSRGFLSAYIEFLDIFFAHPEVEFRCLAVDKHKIDYRKYHESNRETGFYAFYGLALSRNMDPACRYMVFTDERNNRGANRLGDLKATINAYGREKGAPGDMVANVEPRVSKTCEQLQMVDVLLGAVGYDIEEYNTSEARLEVVAHIEKRLGCAKLREHRGRDTRFNIWRFDFARVRDRESEKPDEAEGAAQTPNRA